MADQHGDPARCCGGCKHWHNRGGDPNNLGAPHQGDCRHSPPVGVLVPTPHGLLPGFGYPTLPENFPACGQFALALVAANGRVN